jgi:hypothetical protein
LPVSVPGYPVGVDINGLLSSVGYATSALAANVKAFGAKGDGTTDDTSAIQATINYAIANPTRCSGVYFPSGVYRVTSTLTWPTGTGLSIYGAGMRRSSSLGTQVGTVIEADGITGPVINIDAHAAARMQDLTIDGTGAAFCLRLQNRPGQGAGELIFDNIILTGADIGFNTGHLDEGDEDHDTNNGADVSFRRVTFNTEIGFQCLRPQNVNFFFDSCGFPPGCDVCFDCPQGGVITAINVSAYDVGVILRQGDGGPNIGYSTFIGLKIDGSTTDRTKLYEAVGVGYPAKALFINPHFNLNQVAAAGPSPSRLIAGTVG